MHVACTFTIQKPSRSGCPRFCTTCSYRHALAPRPTRLVHATAPRTKPTRPDIPICCLHLLVGAPASAGARHASVSAHIGQERPARTLSGCAGTSSHERQAGGGGGGCSQRAAKGQTRACSGGTARSRMGATGGDRSVRGPTPSALAHLVDVLARGGDVALGAGVMVAGKEARRRRRPAPARLAPTPLLIRYHLLLGERQDRLLLRHHLFFGEHRCRRRPVPGGTK